MDKSQWTLFTLLKTKHNAMHDIDYNKTPKVVRVGGMLWSMEA